MNHCYFCERKRDRQANDGQVFKVKGLQEWACQTCTHLVPEVAGVRRGYRPGKNRYNVTGAKKRKKNYTVTKHGKRRCRKGF